MTKWLKNAQGFCGRRFEYMLPEVTEQLSEL